MGRRLRLFGPGGYYHLGARGNNGEPIVRDDLDRLDFLRWLSRIVFEQQWRVVTYCLMTNHYHLLMRPAEQGFEVTGHHEIVVPLLRAAILLAAERGQATAGGGR